MNKKAFITGATGYIGSKLVTALLADEWEIHILKRKQSNMTLLQNNIHSIQTHEYDGTIESMVRAIGEAKPVIVFHLASLFIVEHKPSSISQMVESNILLCSQVLEAMVLVGSQYLVNASTSWKYHGSNTYNPVNLYAATKKAAEDIIEYYRNTKDIKCVSLVIYDTYGEDDKRRKFLNLLKEACRNKTPFSMSLGEQVLNFTHVDDVAEAFVIAGKQLCRGMLIESEYAIRTEDEFQLRALTKKLIEINKYNIDIEVGALPYRNREVMSPVKNIQTLPGWKPRKLILRDLKFFAKE